MVAFFTKDQDFVPSIMGAPAGRVQEQHQKPFREISSRYGMRLLNRQETHTMELWKIHKFCESATLEQLEEREKRLVSLMEANSLSDTNAQKLLAVVREYIELKRMFGD